MVELDMGQVVVPISGYLGLEPHAVVALVAVSVHHLHMITVAALPITTQLKAESAAIIWGLTLSDLLQLIATLFTLLTVIYAAKQIRSAGRTAKAQLILMIDESLHHYEDVRAAINAGKLPVEDSRLRRYVARFGRIGMLLQLKQIDLDTVNKLYGSRIKKLLDTSGDQVRRIVQKKEHTGWQPMIYLWHEMYNNHGERNLPTPPALPEASPASYDDGD
jgi:hypothetical protein